MKTLFSCEWLEIRETRGGYQYMHQRKGRGVAVLPWRHTDRGIDVLCRYEVVPPHGNAIKMVALTGMMERDEDPAKTAIRELHEEAGVVALLDDLRVLGIAYPSKASDEAVYMFSVKSHDRSSHRDVLSGPGDGTEHEATAYCAWRPVADALSQTYDPVLCMMIARLTAPARRSH